MKITHVKILWGRAAIRCSFPACRIELTTEGASSTLGEIAHIVAKSPESPRGSSQIQAEQIDDYSNPLMSKIKIEKAQLTPIMVVTGNHNLLIGKELGYGSSSYHTWANVANVF